MDIEGSPPITTAYLAGSVLTSVLVQCRFVNAYQLFYAPRPVFAHGQAWRLLVGLLEFWLVIDTCGLAHNGILQTNFLFFGDLSLDFCFHMFFFARYAKMLETGAFHGRTADFLWMLIVCAVLLLCLAPLSPSPFLSYPLSFTLVYIWSRLNPHVRLSLFGALTITAPNLPYALVIFSWALNSSWHGVIGDLLGIAVGHVIYFFHFVWKEELASGKRNWLATPSLLQRSVDFLQHGRRPPVQQQQ